ncbi:MAG TPA: glycosyltransferase [Bacteroidales bacterium]|nr:glycosyltransferase [Bacteroidales bacterium]
MKKICLILPDLHKGGMERVMAELACYFYARHKSEIYIILLLNHAKVFYKIPPEVTIIRPSFAFNNNKRIISTIRTLIFVRKTVKQLAPDSILSFGETYNSFVLMSCLFTGFNVFVSDRSRPDKSWGFLQEKLRKILYPGARGIISQTTFSRDFLIKETGHKNILIIPNPITYLVNHSGPKENVILNVGRIIKSKRLDLLLNIFSRCNNENWKLWIVGENETGLQTILSEQSKELRISDKVIFWGKQEDMSRFYNISKIFAFTSESEGLPNVLLEAMSAGLACISFDCIAGPSDLIQNGENGFLVDLYDCNDYVYKLNKLISDDSLQQYFSTNAKSKSQEFDINIIGEKYYNFLQS